MDSPKQDSLFTEIAADEAETLSGGRGRRRSNNSAMNTASVGFDSPYGMRGQGFYFDLQAYIFGIGAAYLFGNPGVTREEMQYVWQMALKFW